MQQQFVAMHDGRSNIVWCNKLPLYRMEINTLRSWQLRHAAAHRKNLVTHSSREATRPTQQYGDWP
jgi:hypothetical protein